MAEGQRAGRVLTRYDETGVEYHDDGGGERNSLQGGSDFFPQRYPV